MLQGRVNHYFLLVALTSMLDRLMALSCQLLPMPFVEATLCDVRRHIMISTPEHVNNL